MQLTQLPALQRQGLGACQLSQVSGDLAEWRASSARSPETSLSGGGGGHQRLLARLVAGLLTCISFAVPTALAHSMLVLLVLALCSLVRRSTALFPGSLAPPLHAALRHALLCGAAHEGDMGATT